VGAHPIRKQGLRYLTIHCCAAVSTFFTHESGHPSGVIALRGLSSGAVISETTFRISDTGGNVDCIGNAAFSQRKNNFDDCVPETHTQANIDAGRATGEFMAPNLFFQGGRVIMSKNNEPWRKPFHGFHPP
jgi:hypothetical protein